MKFLASLAALTALSLRFAAAADGQVSDYMVAQAWLKPLTVKAGGKVSVTLDFVLLEDDGARGRRLDSYTTPTEYIVMVRSKESKPGAKGSVSFQDPPPTPPHLAPPPPPPKISTWPHPPFHLTVYPWRAGLRNVLQQEQDQQVSEREGLRVHQVHPFPQPLQAQVRSKAIVIPLCSAEYPLALFPSFPHKSHPWKKACLRGRWRHPQVDGARRRPAHQQGVQSRLQGAYFVLKEKRSYPLTHPPTHPPTHPLTHPPTHPTCDTYLAGACGPPRRVGRGIGRHVCSGR